MNTQPGLCQGGKAACSPAGTAVSRDMGTWHNHHGAFVCTDVLGTAALGGHKARHTVALMASSFCTESSGLSD